MTDNNSAFDILIKDEAGSYQRVIFNETDDFSNAVIKNKTLTEDKAQIQNKKALNQIKNNSTLTPVAIKPDETDGLEQNSSSKSGKTYFLQPPPPAVIKSKASFYFHTEDEDEVAKDLLNKEEVKPKKHYSLDKIVDKVMVSYNFNLTEVNKLRLKNSIYNFLRDRRDAVATREILTKNIPNGGLSLDENLAESILQFLKEIKSQIKAKSGVVVEENELVSDKFYQPKNTVNKDYNLNKEPDSTLLPAPLKKETEKDKFELTRPPVSLEDIKTNQAEDKVHKLELDSDDSVSNDINKLKEPSTRPSSFKIPNVKLNKTFIRPFNQPSRITDVKGGRYKLTGPVDELANLDLVTFRRLSQDIRERAQKIINKINSLAEDSLSKKAAGVKAWRSSALYRMYLAVGKASIEHNLSVEEIIKEYASKGRDIISFDEFNVISDINKRIRF